MYYTNRENVWNGIIDEHSMNEEALFLRTHWMDRVNKKNMKDLVSLALSYVKCTAIIVGIGVMIMCFVNLTKVEGTWTAAKSYDDYPTEITIEKDDSVLMDGLREAHLIQGMICQDRFTDEDNYSIKAWKDLMWLDDKLYIRK